MPIKKLALAIVLLFFLSTQPSEATQNNTKKKFWVNSSKGQTIEIDGVLNEKEWSIATVIQLSYEVQPGENIAPKVETECFLTYDETHLYAACRADDPKPAAIRAHYSDRDRASNDDHIGIVIDPFNDERRAFKFLVNPVGVQMDQFQDDVGRINDDATWDAIWNSAGRITADGYIVEMAIPFRSIHFPSTEGLQTWGIDFIRVYPRDKRYLVALNPRDRDIDCYLCQISKATGFEGITPGNNLEFDPTFTASRREQRPDLLSDALENDTSTDAGLSMIWGMTPNWTLNATLNPDFSNVEADVAQLNVNRQFALSFPERRPFFLEGADIFETLMNAIFTRNVADPIMGVKLTGKSGKNAAGFLSSYDEITNFLFPGPQGSRSATVLDETVDSVFRYRRDVGANSAIGLLATDREGIDYYNRVVGADGNLRVTPSNSIRFQAMGSQTDYPDNLALQFSQPSDSFTGYAYNVQFNHSSRNWFFSGRHQNVHSDFRADMGFIPRVDTKFYATGLGYNVVPDADDWYTFITISGDASYRTDQEGNFLGRVWLGNFQLGGPLQSIFTIDSGINEQVFGGITFDQLFVNTSFSMSPNKSTFLFISATLGEELDFVNIRKGDIVRLLPLVQFRFGQHFLLDLSYTFEKLDIDGENLFTANLPQIRLLYQFNTRAFVRLITQYSQINRNPALFTDPVEPKTTTLFNQFLFSYKFNPRTVLFLGYSDNHLEIIDVPLTRTNRTFFLKVGYAWQL